ncbi:MAG: GLUG motif-containing protein, partial [Thalassolituus sp.]
MSIAYAESGRTDYDLDDDGLIEINSLADLNEIRNNLDGTSLYGESTGCPAEGCNGFELTTTLDFDTNADGVMDANDTYWNDGEGWVPIGDAYSPFTAIFDGNGHQIRNLHIDRPSTDYVGLFGYVKGEAASLRNLGLTGKRMSVLGRGAVGGLIGRAEEASITQNYSTGVVTGDDNVGGLVGGLYRGSLNNSFATGSVTGNGDVGGLAGDSSNSTLNNSFATGSVTGDEDVGGLIGQISSSSLSNSFATGSVTGDEDVGGLIGQLSSSSLSNSFATGYVNGNSRIGGLLGSASISTFTNNHWATDTSGQASSARSSNESNYFGATLAELQCPTSSDDSECLIGNTLYTSWDDTVWSFGSNQELPGLIIDGVVYRDSDGDGSLDSDDAFPNNRAGSVDNDNDGYLDSWTLGCDGHCRSTSGLTLDQFPMTGAAWLDADLDGYPDSWAAGCDASCQNDSGLTLDASTNDVDNDGII